MVGDLEVSDEQEKRKPIRWFRQGSGKTRPQQSSIYDAPSTQEFIWVGNLRGLAILLRNSFYTDRHLSLFPIDRWELLEQEPAVFHIGDLNIGKVRIEVQASRRDNNQGLTITAICHDDNRFTGVKPQYINLIADLQLYNRPWDMLGEPQAPESEKEKEDKGPIKKPKVRERARRVYERVYEKGESVGGAIKAEHSSYESYQRYIKHHAPKDR